MSSGKDGMTTGPATSAHPQAEPLHPAMTFPCGPDWNVCGKPVCLQLVVASRKPFPGQVHDIGPQKG